MFDKAKELWKLKKIQDDVKRQLEQIFVEHEDKGIKILLRGDKRVEKIEIDGTEDKRVREVFNEAFKELDKKVNKKMQGQLSELGFPGL